MSVAVPPGVPLEAIACPVLPFARPDRHRPALRPSGRPAARRVERPVATDAPLAPVVVPITVAVRRPADNAADVAALIRELGPQWHVSTAVPLGALAVADLIVVGPAGVFTVTVASHPDAEVHVRGESVRVDGTGTGAVRTARVHAALAEALLTAETGRTVRVRSIVAIGGSDVRITIVGQPGDGAVTVLDAREIAVHLASLRETLDIALTIQTSDRSGESFAS